MDMNLRKDGYFVQDSAWYEAERCFGDFVSRSLDRKLVLLELGVGFNTPTIIRFPFEKLTREHDNITLVRLNLDQAVIPESLGNRAIGINADTQEERKKRSLYIIKTEGKGWKTTEIKRKKYRSVMCVSAVGSGLRSSL